MVYKEGGGTGTVDTSEDEQQSWSASDQEVGEFEDLVPVDLQVFLSKVTY